MKLKIFIGILVFLIVLNLATIGTFLFVHFTQKGPLPPRPYPAGRFSGVPERGMHPMMGLERGKRLQLMKLLEEFRNDTRDLKLQVDSLETQVISLMHEDPVPMNKVDSLLKDVSVLHLEIRKRAAKKLVEAKSFLSPEQQDRFYRAILQVRPNRPHMRNCKRFGEQRPVGPSRD